MYEMLANAIHQDRLREAERHRLAAIAKGRKTKKRSWLVRRPRRKPAPAV